MAEDKRLSQRLDEMENDMETVKKELVGLHGLKETVDQLVEQNHLLMKKISEQREDVGKLREMAEIYTNAKGWVATTRMLFVAWNWVWRIIAAMAILYVASKEGFLGWLQSR